MSLRHNITSSETNESKSLTVYAIFLFAKKLPSVIESNPELNKQISFLLKLFNTLYRATHELRAFWELLVKTDIFCRIIPVFVTECAMANVHVMYTLPGADSAGGACTRILSRRSYIRGRVYVCTCPDSHGGCARYVAPGGTIIQQKNRETFVRPPLIPKLPRRFWRICIKP